MTAKGEGFFVTGGSLRRDASSYVVRRTDEELYAALTRKEYCYVLTSRQMGKSSLTIRAAVRLREAGVRVAVLDLTAIGQNLTPDQWYDGLLQRVAQQLDLEDTLEAFWNKSERLGPLQRFMAALREVVLTDSEETSPSLSSSAAAGEDLVIFIDEIDTVRSLPFSTDEFFAAIRECYNRRDQDSRFNHLTFCLLGVASPTDLIRNTNMTPFNIGRRIELNDFTLEEAAALAKGLMHRKDAPAPGADGNSGEDSSAHTSSTLVRGEALISRILYWTGGHPYLTQRLCLAVAEAGDVHELLNSADVDRICSELFFSTQARERDDNLIFVRERLLRNEEERAALLDMYSQVQSGKRVRNEETHSLVTLLRLSGIVRAADGFLKVRNRIYARVFDRAWIRENMPYAELRRQKRAFRQGAIRALAVSGILLFSMIGVILATRYQTHLRVRHVLSDGTTLTLEDVTYGKKHHYEPGSFRWQDLLAGANHNVQETETDCLYAWITHRETRTQKTVSQHLKAIAVDEHGCFFASDWSPGAAMVYDVDGYRFNSFPRRGKTISLRIFDSSLPSSQITEFSVHNPAPTLYPLWTPEPYPITKPAGDLFITLNGLRTIPNRSDRGVNSDTMVPEFRFTQNGRPTEEWETGEVLPLSDATGNVSRIAPGAVDSCNLCPFEPAWRLEGVFFRKKTAHFSADETWTVKHVPVPGPGRIQAISRTMLQNGVTLKLMSMAGPGHFSYTNNGRGKPLGTWKTSGAIRDGVRGFDVGSTQNNRQLVQTVSCSLPHLAINVDKWDRMDDNRLTIWATDDKRRQFNMEYSGHTSEQGYYALDIPSDVKTVDLHFVVQRSRKANFLIKPPLPSGTTGKSRTDRPYSGPNGSAFP